MFQNRGPIQEGDGKAHATTVNILPTTVIVLSAERNKDWSECIQKVFKVMQIFLTEDKTTQNNHQSGIYLNEVKFNNQMPRRKNSTELLNNMSYCYCMTCVYMIKFSNL